MTHVHGRIESLNTLEVDNVSLPSDWVEARSGCVFNMEPVGFEWRISVVVCLPTLAAAPIWLDALQQILSSWRPCRH